MTIPDPDGADVAPDAVGRIPCVGAIVRDEFGRLLMIRRGHAPAEGSWSLPGGRIEPGESDEAAVAREVVEETGIIVLVDGLVGQVDIPAPAGGVFDVRDYAATPLGGDLRAGDDAADAAWVAPGEVMGLNTPPGFVETLRGWGVIPPDADPSVEIDSEAR